MEQQIQQLIDMTEKGLTQMASQIGIALPQLWEILIKQQYVEAVQAFFVFAVCLIFWGIAYKKRKTIENFRKGDPNCYDNFERSAMLVIFIVTFFVITMIAFVEAVNGIGKVINPEYYAIKDIVGFISNMNKIN